ncbi:hypothetical protein, partial [Gluconobacter japonicus]|uniref:hypothetical protein n=1 Tax=Gluconobacter japonicus TaxID=376620 RepID=UPI0039EB8CD3
AADAPGAEDWRGAGASSVGAGTEVTSDISNAASKSHHTFSRNKFVSLVATFKTRTVSINRKILSNLNERSVDKDLPIEDPIRKTPVNIRKYL